MGHVFSGTESEPDFQRSSPASFTESADIEALADAMKESPSGSVHSVPDTDTQLHSDTHMSALEMENHMLKNEVASLTQEMTAIIERAKKSQTGIKKHSFFTVWNNLDDTGYGLLSVSITQCNTLACLLKAVAILQQLTHRTMN